MRKQSYWMTGVLALLLWGARAFAATNYVATTGCDTNSGMEASPKLTIAAALTNCVNGDTILVAPGTYLVTNQIVVASGVTIRSLHGYESTTVKRDTTLSGVDPVYTNRIFWLNHTNATLDGLKISDGFSNVSGGNVLIDGNGGGIIKDCMIVNGNAIGNAGGIYLVGTGVIERCAIVSNTATYGYGGGVCIRLGATNGVLRNCLIFGNAAIYDGASQFTGNGGGVCIKRGGTVVGCTIVSNTCTTPAFRVNKQGGGIYHVLDNPQYASDHYVSNTIVWGNRHAEGGLSGTKSPNNVDAEPTFGLPLYINCYYTEDYAPDNPDPFVASSDGNYSLPTNSPRLETGWAPNQGLFAATNGSDVNSGRSWTTAVSSITRALSRAHERTRVTVGPGAYTNGLETFPLVVAYKGGLEIRGASYSTTVINAAGSNRRVLTMTNSPNVLVTGVAFTGGNLTNGYGSGLALWGCSGVVVAACAISNNLLDRESGDGNGGGMYSHGSSVSMSNSLVMGNTVRTEFSPQGGGICMAGGSLVLWNVIMTSNSVVSRNPGAAGKARGGGLANSNGVCAMRNCLVAGNSCGVNTNLADRGDGFFMTGSSATSILENCTVVYNGGQGINRQEGLATVTNSILWGNGDDIYGTIVLGYSDIQTADTFWTNGFNGCRSSDPHFVSAGAGNYRLSSGSWCRDRGNNEAWMYTTVDLDGSSRVTNNVVDMGCYESTAPCADGIIISVSGRLF